MKTTRRTRRIARRLYRLCLRDGRLDGARVRQVAARLTAASGRHSLPVLVELRRLIRLDRDAHSAVIESAVPLPDAVRRDLEAELTRRHGGDVAIAAVVRPELLGGVRITAGSRVYDGSVRGRLDALQARW
jgi:F-type H+-transporting ATPase subunit delta